MIVGYINGQSLEIHHSNVVEKSVDYLTADFQFMTNEWKGFRKWVHFSKGDIHYQIELKNDKVLKTDHLNLSSGEWDVYIHGSLEREVITTNKAKLLVQTTGELEGNYPEETPIPPYDDILNKMGDVENLKTTDKTNLVNSINEVLRKANQGGGGTGGGGNGVGIEKIEQIKTSTASSGVNVVRVYLTNGDSYDFEVRNGRGVVGLSATQNFPTDRELEKIDVMALYSDGHNDQFAFWVPYGKDGKDGKSGVYVGSGDMPDGYNVQIDPEGKAVVIPTKVSELENDSGFITKADIPTDESYELIGETPFTLSKTANIKLVSDGETDFSIYSPTVWSFDTAEYTTSNVSLSTDKGYYEFTNTGTPTAYHQCWVQCIITGLKVGTEYKLLFDVEGLSNNSTNRIWHGQLNIYHGSEIKTANLIVGGYKPYKGALSIIPTTDSICFRYYPADNKSPFDGWVGHFNNIYLNYADASEKLTEIYSNSGNFTDVTTIKAVPSGVTITTTPTAKVYEKSATDTTLTKSDTPADAKVTGEKIEEVKNMLSLYGKKIVNFGDSIFGNARPPKDVSTFLAEKTGAEVLNCAFGGCRMGSHTGHWDCFSMYRLADAIANNDYSLQEDALNYDDRVSYAEEPLALIKSTDFSTVDIVTISYCTNDFTGGNKIDNEENPLDTTTLGGALRYSIEKLLTAYPNLRIFILSATYRFWKDDNNEFTEDSSTYLNKHSKTLPEYNAKLAEVASEYNLPFIDNYNIGIGKFNRYQYFPVTDGTHHNETGRRLIASHLAKELY